jgi:hypothetical protein
MELAITVIFLWVVIPHGSFHINSFNKLLNKIYFQPAYSAAGVPHPSFWTSTPSDNAI